MEGFTHLVKVVPAPPQAGDEIKLLTLELYEDGFIVRWVLPKGPPTPASSAAEASLNPMGFMALTLRDPLGTPYELVSMTAGGAQGLTLYRPAIPPEAEWLDVFTSEGAVRFDLETD